MDTYISLKWRSANRDKIYQVVRESEKVGNRCHRPCKVDQSFFHLVAALVK